MKVGGKFAMMVKLAFDQRILMYFPRRITDERDQLTPEQEQEAERITDILMAKMRVEAQNIGRLLASKDSSELFGQTEFQLRDRLLRLGAHGIDAALSERKRRGTKDPV